MTALVAMLALGAVCWGFRAAFVVAFPATKLPARLRRGLEHLAPAVLAAMVAVETHAAARGASATVAVLVVAAVALIAVAVRRFGSLPLAIGLGAVAALVIDLVVLG